MEFKYKNDPDIRVADKGWISELHEIFKQEFPLEKNTAKGELIESKISQLLARPPHRDTRAAFVHLEKEGIFELHWSYINKKGLIIRELDRK